MNFSRRTAILIAGGAIILLVALVALFMPRGADDSTALMETATVRRGTLVATVNATGSIGPRREAQLGFSGAGSLAKLNVKQGDLVKTGQLLATLDTRALEFQLVQAEASLAGAQAKLDQLKNPSPADVAAAQASVASAEAALAQLQRPTQNDLVIAKADVDKAKAALDRAQADYDRIGGASNPAIGMTPQSVALQQATIDYQRAAAAYNARINPTDSQLKQAQATLEQARAQLAKLTAPTANDLRSAQANVDQMRAARDLAQAKLDDAVLRAPFDGFVTHVDFDLGSLVPVGRTVLTIADPSELRVEVNIDETDIARVGVGQEVTIGLDAYPEVTMAARVSEVAASATVTQGVVNYIVTVTVDPGDVPARMGMTANANIVVGKKDNVLLVPNRAIRASGSKRFVILSRPNGESQEVEVRLGLANDQETEVIEGLSEGQQVLISGAQMLNPALSPFGSRR